MNYSSIAESWQVATKTFSEQADLNTKELESEANYPDHWIDCLNVVNQLKVTTFLDIGSGAGAIYRLFAKNNLKIQYKGFDYSPEAVKIASSYGDKANFFQYDFWKLNINLIAPFDLLYAGALFDVMRDGDHAIEFLLSLQPKWLLIGRPTFTEKESYDEEYIAYDSVETVKHHHNTRWFEKSLNYFKYRSFPLRNSILLGFNG